jgi:hypothetical protein
VKPRSAYGDAAQRVPEGTWPGAAVEGNRGGQQKEIAAQRATATQQQKQIDALTATVRRVSERIEISAPARRIAANED